MCRKWKMVRLERRRNRESAEESEVQRGSEVVVERVERSFSGRRAQTTAFENGAPLYAKITARQGRRREHDQTQKRDILKNTTRALSFESRVSSLVAITVQRRVAS